MVMGTFDLIVLWAAVIQIQPLVDEKYGKLEILKRGAKHVCCTEAHLS